MSVTRIAAILLIFTSGLHFFFLPTADNDLWGHVLFGQEMLDLGAIPPVNSYSYTAPDHAWINHEILAEIAMALSFGLGGSSGLLALKLGLGFATLAVIGWTTRRRTEDPVAWAVACVAAASLMSFGYLVRPQIFTFLAFAILLDRVHAHASERRALSWEVPLLFCIWVNSHGGVLAGLAVLGTFSLVRGLANLRSRETKRLVAVVACSSLALLVNPYGPELVEFLIRDVLRDRPIPEWNPIEMTLDFGNAHFKAGLAVFLLVVIVRRKTPPWEVAVVSLTAIAALRHERHLPLFGIAFAPWLGAQVGSLLAAEDGRPRIGRAAASAIAAGMIALAIVQVRGTSRLAAITGFRIFVPSDVFPVEALRFLSENDLGGNVAVPFGWGEYAIWHLPPGSLVSIDGRYTTAYPDETIDAAWRYMAGGPGWEQHLASADIAIANRRHATPGLLFNRPEWTYVYSDPIAFVFVRTGSTDPKSLVRTRKPVETAFP